MQPEVGAVMEEGETEAETAKNQYQVSPKNLYPARRTGNQMEEFVPCLTPSAEDRKSDEEYSRAGAARTEQYLQG